MSEQERDEPPVDRLEREIKELKPESDAAIERVDSALGHLAAATADIEAIRGIEALARR